MKRVLAAILFLAAALYAGICGFLVINQNTLLYPGTTLPPHAATLSLPRFSDGSGRQLGWVAEPATPPVATVVFFHGNDEEAWQTDQNTAAEFTSRGYRVVYAEYPGYDFRIGEYPTHNTVIAGGIAIVNLVRADYPGQTLFLAGNSLGAGIAAQVAAAAAPARVILFVPWDRLSAVAQERYPFVPVRALLALQGTDYDSCAALKAQADKVFIVYAGQDTTIPPHHAVALANCLGVPDSRRVFLPQSGHSQWDTQLSPGQWNTLLAHP